MCDMLYFFVFFFFFFKQKTAYEMRISDWSSDVCSSDLAADGGAARDPAHLPDGGDDRGADRQGPRLCGRRPRAVLGALDGGLWRTVAARPRGADRRREPRRRAPQEGPRPLRAVEAQQGRATRLGRPLGPRPHGATGR